MEITKNINDDADTVLDTGSDNETVLDVQKEELSEKLKVKPIEKPLIKPKKEISNRKLINLILIDTLCKQPNLWFMQCGHIIRPYFRPIHYDSNKSSEFRITEQYNPFRNTNTKFPQIYNEDMIELINRIKIDISEDESFLTYTDPSGVVRRPYFRRSSTDPIIAPSKLVLIPKPIIVAPRPVLVSKPILNTPITGKRKLNEFVFSKEEEEDDEKEYVYISQARPFIPVVKVLNKKPKIVPVPVAPPPPPPPPPSPPPPPPPSFVSTLIIQPPILVETKDCRYSNNCHRADCSFKHPSGYIPQPYMCRSDKKCHNFSCKYKHSDGYIPCPIVRCRFGNNCDIKKNCYYSHPDDKWWSSLK